MPPVVAFVVAALTASGPHLVAAHRPQFIELLAADEFKLNDSQASGTSRKVQCKCYYKCWLVPIEYSYTALVEDCNGDAIARVLEQRPICKFTGLYNGAWNCEEKVLPREFYLDFDVVDQYLKLTQAATCKHRCLEIWKGGHTLESVSVQKAGRSLRKGGHTLEDEKGLILGPGKESGMTGFIVKVADSAKLGGADCVASFRGTQGEQVDHIITDAKAVLVDWKFGNCPGCRVHRGFQDAYSELRNKLHMHIKTLGCKNVAFTGHSLGAGVATIATLDRRLHDGDSPTPYLFHSPRVGNQAFSDAFKRSHKAPTAFRFVNGCDPVPRVPARLQGFVHVPGEIYWHNGGEANKESYQICPGAEDPDCMGMRGLTTCVAQFKDELIPLHMSLFGENLWPDNACQHDSCAEEGDPDDEITCECSYNCKILWYSGPGLQKSYRTERRDCHAEGMRQEMESHGLCQWDIWGKGIQSVWRAGIWSVWSCSEK